MVFANPETLIEVGAYQSQRRPMDEDAQESDNQMIDLAAPLPSRRERKALAKANNTAFVPLAPPPVEAQ